MFSEQNIERLYNEACELSVKVVIEKAIEILKTHKKIHGFTMGMGVASFYRKNGTLIESWEKDYTDKIKAFDDFVNKWDFDLHITGTPIKIIKPKMEVITNW